MGEWWDSAWSERGGENGTSARASVADRPYSAGGRWREKKHTFASILYNTKKDQSTQLPATMGQRQGRFRRGGMDVEMENMNEGEC